jgi:signal transduction histidine kinase
MSLRAKLACALMAAALLPMAVAVGAAMLRAGREAERETTRRADAVQRQAELLVERHRRALRERMDLAAADLVHDYFAIESLLADPAAVRSHPLAQSLATRHALDHVEILGGDGEVVSCSRHDHQPGSRSPLSGLPEDEIVATRPPAFSLRMALRVGNRPFTLAGSLALDSSFLRDLAEITGARATLVQAGIPAGPEVVADSASSAPGSAPPPLEAAPPGKPANDTVPIVLALGVGLELRLAVPAADAAGARRELLTILGGLAPFALICALAVGLLLAQGISGPVRRLAQRADEIAVERAGPLSLPQTRDEVGRLTQSFERMLDALESSERQRLGAERVAAWQEIARRIAHEVKNPLSPIQLAVQNLLRTYEKAPTEFEHALREEAATILEEVDSLRRLVDEFSQFARLPPPRLQPCDPQALLDAALALFSGRIHDLGVTVEVYREDPPAKILADPELLGRALKNIVGNALDAMEPVAERRLSIAIGRVVSAGRGQLEIRVTDSGVGLTDESRRRLFEPYYTTRSDRGGSGLGLAITHRIVADHGGSITARGEPGKGATITLCLPEDGFRASKESA